ncbi:hypothetical protein JOQ06_014687 [Pogonophryne albipinna]|uniref:Specifically androgen-regulated gene protein n=1 Tax=Pogonophryne albipinna TaxID=1090488 RepID=A0AAD6AK67_9TELE|nr:hypothetical protein JOQ06_014687 [Pogonophryne albipinna]
MPKSDTWPGGIGLETSMDSAGSCDSVVSANSIFSDDSLEHLSAEEKACLMFLEETIDSLDTEEDSGLSNDEPDQLPSAGNLVSKLADLSASMSKTKLNSLQKQDFSENADTKPMHSYLVPTPFVIASSSPCSIPNAKAGFSPDKNLSSKSQFPPSSNKPDHKHKPKPVNHHVSFDANVGIPPATKPRDLTEGLPRGPLSYDALVYLRRSASTKKTPLCPTIDHTIDLNKHLPVTEEGPHFGNLPRSDRFNSEAFKSKTDPPVVAPKPKQITAKTSVKTPNAEDISYNIKNAKDPKVVRLEALEKLGLLKDEQPKNETVAPRPPTKSPSSLDPTTNRFSRGTSNANPSRSPSLSYSHAPTEPKNKALQSSASFHLCSRRDQLPASASHSAPSNGVKAASLERAATRDQHRNAENAQPVPHKPPNSVGYTVMVVPGMGADRKEALRKLGLLKD